MTQVEYGEHYQEHLLDQYKLYVEMADKVSARRADSNQFYVKVLSALLAIIALAAKLPLGNSSAQIQKITNLAIIMLALVLCAVWYVNIESYRQLNSGKFAIIHEMEKTLPFPCYDAEWDQLKRGANRKFYLPLTHVERYVPGILAVPFLVLLGCLLANW
jgi:hypothetical protein